MGKVPISSWLNRQRSAHGNRLSGALLSAFTTNLLVQPSPHKHRDSKWAPMGQQQPKHQYAQSASENLSAVSNSLQCTTAKSLCSSPHGIPPCYSPTNALYSVFQHSQCSVLARLPCPTCRAPMKPRNSMMVLPSGQEPHRLTVRLKPVVADLVCQCVHPAPPHSRSL